MTYRDLLIAVAMLLVSSATSVIANDLVVVEARGVEFKPGDKLNSEGVLRLPAGARLTLVTVRGETVRLRGPFEDRPVRSVAAGQTGVVDSLRNLMTRPTDSALTPGVVRSGQTGADLPEPWIVDIAREGDHCIEAGQPIVFWTAQPSGEAVPFAIRPGDRRWEAKGNWPAGQDRIAMPPTLPIQSGQMVRIAIGAAEVGLILHFVPQNLPSQEMKAAFLLEMKCERQAQAIARTLKVN
jgi:hypothetical protein